MMADCHNQSSKFRSASGSYKYAAVVTDAELCSQIGNDVLARHRGNAVDATVASLLCIGVVNAHSAGIGGGSFITVYQASSGKTYSVNSRETAPGGATEDMYLAPEDRIKSRLGGLAVGVPGEVLGLYQLHQTLGSGAVPWSDLVMPTARLCEDGVPLSEATHKALVIIQAKGYPNFEQQFAPYFDANNNPHPPGTLIKLPELARTFREIAADPLTFYRGSLARRIVEDIREQGGIITYTDLASYSVSWERPTELHLPGNLTVFSTPPPGSGLVLSYILSILAGYNLSPADIANVDSEVLTTHRVVEAFKFAFAKRSELGDGPHKKNSAKMTSLAFGEETRARIDDGHTHNMTYYQPHFAVVEDSGTSHLSVIDGEGNAVSVTSSINHYFGSKVRGARTGIIFNNEMDDFSTPNTTNFFGLPASPANFIAPGKRPMSSMCPAVVIDNQGVRGHGGGRGRGEVRGHAEVRMLAGASGGSMITTATALSIMDVLWLGRSMPESVDQPRYHHQLSPHRVQVDEGFSQAVIDGLKAKGHDVITEGFSVVQAAYNTGAKIIGVADFRKGGKPAGF